MKKLIPTLCMALLGLSVIGTSSYAWFSMNKTVYASFMQVKVKATGGIQIKREKANDKDFGSSATSKPASSPTLSPTSTADAEKWYTADGTSSSDGTHTGDYTPLSVTDTKPTTEAIGIGKVGTDTSELTYYLYDTYTVATDNANLEFSDLWVSNVSVTSDQGSITTLAKAIRVLVKCGEKVVIAAPVTGATTSYNVNGSTEIVAVDYASTDQTKATSQNTLVSSDTTSTTVSVYVYYEGEDAACKTNNVTGESIKESLSVSVTFQTTNVA